MNDKHGAQNQEKRPAYSGVYDWMGSIVFALVCMAVVFTLLFRVVSVQGESMWDTLQNGDRLILTDLNYTPSRGDIVVVNRYVDEPLIKRVIAVAGDTIDIDAENNEVILNGKVLQEDYVHYPTLQYEFSGPVTVPQGCVFVMGDHRNNSHDSRMTDVGFVDTHDIVGKAVLRLWPFAQFK